jgi:hypothetical protein
MDLTTAAARIINLTLSGPRDATFNVASGSTVDLSAAKKATGNIINVDAFTADEDTTLIGSATGVTTFTGGEGADTMTGGSANDVYIGKEGNNVVNLSSGGTDKVVLDNSGYDTVNNFTAGDDTTTGYDTLSLGTTLTGAADLVFASVSTNAVTLAAPLKITVINSILNGSQLASSEDGTGLLAALKVANGGTTVDITANADTDTGYMVAYQGSNAYVYYYDADSGTADTAVTSDEITLIAKLVGVSSGLLDADNFVAA